MQHKEFKVPPQTVLLPIMILVLFALEFGLLSRLGLPNISVLASISLQLLVAISLLSQAKIIRKTHYVTAISLALFTGFSIVASIATLASGDHIALSSQRYLMIVLIAVMLVFGISMIASSERVINLVSIVVVSAGVIATLYATIFAVLSTSLRKDELILFGIKFTQCTMGSPTALRMCSLTGNPNTFAMFLVFTSIATIYLNTRKQIGRLLTTVLLLFLAYGHSLAMSRTGLLATIAGIGAIILLQWMRKPPRWHQFAGLFVLIIAGVLGVLKITDGTRILSSDLSGRSEIWGSLIEAISAFPWTGQGFGVSSEAIVHGAGRELSGHNFYLVLASEVGLPATAIFLMLWLIAIIFSIKKFFDGELGMLLPATFLITFFVHQIAEVHILRFSAMNVLFFLMIGFAIAPPCKKLNDSNPIG